jgi:general secretion pathway protein D
VQKIPILAADPVENSGVVFSQVQFEEAGVILNVMPRISRDGTIDLEVNPEYSVVADFIDNNPVIDSRTAETTVRVNDGQMFVLGGLRQKSVVESVRGVPFLKDVKFLGLLFRSHDTEIRESELIVFLKPEIITPYQCGRLREQQAACIATKQLDAIPYAETRPFSPRCKDPYCPNHRPRCRINGGSRELEMMGGHGLNRYEIYIPQEVEIIDQHVEQTTPATPQQQHAPRASAAAATGVIEEVYQPVHVDSRVLTIRHSH